MRKRLFILIGSTLVLCLLAAPAFGATVEGTGVLIARGNGAVRVTGDCSVNASGDGVLTIKDDAGDAKITVTGKGRKKVLEDGTIVYAGFNGHVNVKGSAVVVSLRAKNIKLEAHGTGTAQLRGKGTFKVRGAEGKWTADGITVTL